VAWGFCSGVPIQVLQEAHSHLEQYNRSMQSRVKRTLTILRSDEHIVQFNHAEAEIDLQMGRLADALTAIDFVQQGNSGVRFPSPLLMHRADSMLGLNSA
jgi:nitric oxide reductase activation protein